LTESKSLEIELQEELIKGIAPYDNEVKRLSTSAWEQEGMNKFFV